MTQLDPTRDLTDVLAVRAEHGPVEIHRAEAVQAIRRALRRRSGRSWSVTVEEDYAGETWIVVSAPPSRRTAEFVFGGDFDEYGGPLYQLADCGTPHPANSMSPDDTDALADLLDLHDVHHRGHALPVAALVEFVARAEGRRC